MLTTAHDPTHNTQYILTAGHNNNNCNKMNHISYILYIIARAAKYLKELTDSIHLEQIRCAG